MQPIEELYFLLGYLEGLLNKKNISLEELSLIKQLVDKIPFNLGKAHISKSQIYTRKNSADHFFSTLECSEEAFMIGDPAHDRGENPWIDIFGEGDEAEAAYWNTD